MSLRTRLGLTLSSISKLKSKAPTPIVEVFDFLLTQSDDFIVTQSNDFIGLSLYMDLYDLTTQDDFTIITQNEMIIGASV